MLFLLLFVSINGVAQGIKREEYIKKDALLIDIENMHMLTVNVKFDVVKDFDYHRVLDVRLKAFKYQSGKLWDEVIPLLKSSGENGWVQQDSKGYDFEPAWNVAMNGEDTPQKIKSNMNILMEGFRELPQELKFSILWVLSNTLIIIW